MRRPMLIGGVLVLAAIWLGPLPALARDAFYAHMSMHMGVVAVAAPLLALAVAGGSYDPVRRRPGLFHPIVASVVELIIVWCWHAPGLHHLARGSFAGLAVEQGMFLAAGLLVWLSAFGALGEGKRAAAGVAGLLLTAMHMTLLGALLALATRPLYHTGMTAAGLTALEDQHLGGAIMLIVGGVSYLAGGLALTVRLLHGSMLEAEETS